MNWTFGERFAFFNIGTISDRIWSHSSCVRTNTAISFNDKCTLNGSKFSKSSAILSSLPWRDVEQSYRTVMSAKIIVFFLKRKRIRSLLSFLCQQCFIPVEKSCLMSTLDWILVQIEVLCLVRSFCSLLFHLIVDRSYWFIYFSIFVRRGLGRTSNFKLIVCYLFH